MKFNCPHCQRPTFGLKDKLLAGKWIDLHCRECGGRSCNQPVFLALLYFAGARGGQEAGGRHPPMSGILGVGIATLDIVNEVARTPAEDEEVRALAQRRVRGGNVTNTLVVLARLGHRCAWAGTWAEEPDARVILDDLARHGIDIHPSLAVSEGKVPTSYVTLSRENGARTIVHYRDLPEYPAAAFLELPHRAFQWIHFEGRAVDELRAMLQHLHTHHPALPRSLEVEKPRPGIEALFPLVPLLVFSPGYARHRGFQAAEPFLRAVHEAAPEAVLVWATPSTPASSMPVCKGWTGPRPWIWPTASPATSAASPASRGWRRPSPSRPPPSGGPVHGARPGGRGSARRRSPPTPPPFRGGGRNRDWRGGW